MFWMLLEEFEKHGAGSLGRALEGVDAGQVQVRLIECRRHANAFLEAGNRLIAPLRAEIENTEVVQRLRINGAQFQRFL